MGYWVLGFSITVKLVLVVAYRVSWAKSQSVAIKGQSGRLPK